MVQLIIVIDENYCTKCTAIASLCRIISVQQQSMTSFKEKNVKSSLKLSLQN